MTTTNVLITGTKTGIGYGLLAAFAARPNTVVIAAIRDTPDSVKAKKMVSSVTEVGSGSKIIPIQYDAGKVTGAHEAITDLRKDHPEVAHLDIVVANAGRLSEWGPSHRATAEDILATLNVNTLGPILLYQATRELLLATKGIPRFFVVSTLIGSIASTEHIPFQAMAYGMSKAASNYFAHKANLEEERIVIVPVHPGWVQTEMGNGAATRLGQASAPMSLEESVDGLLQIFDKATKEIGGTFQQVHGDVLPW